MKIGILTFFESDNYGTVLQAYALQAYLEKMGHQASCVWLKRNVNSRSAYYHKTVRTYSLLQRVWNKLVLLRTAGMEKRKQEGFAQFRKAFLHITPVCYESGEAFWKDACGYDLLISGGDQIWNPYHKVFSMDYMLRFLPEAFPRIAYGSSFGVETIQEPKLTALFSQALSKYNAIGVREKSATQLLSMLGVSGKQVLDPVFLDRQHWEELIPQKSPMKKKYGVVYALVDYPDETDKVIRKYACANQLEMVILPENRRNCMNRYRKVFDLSPLDFLRYIRYSEIVFTNSFHGLAFAILFHKQVVVIDAVSEEAKNKQTRLRELMDLLEIAQPRADSIWSPIDYTKVEKKLSEQIQESQAFLTEAIGMIDGGIRQ